MLRLASVTDPGWVQRALADLDEVLIDHAHCEKKAASTAVSLLFRYPEHRVLLAPLSRLAREELRHFEQVVEVLERRGVALRHQEPGSYAGGLMRAVRGEEPGRCVDTLLCMALIEARSCERLGLLAEAIGEPALAAFYRELVAGEARHHGEYVRLAGAMAGGEVEERLSELAAHEAEVLAGVAAMARLHA